MNVKINFKFSEYTDLEAILNKLKDIEKGSNGVIKIDVNADECTGNIPKCTGITQALKIDKEKEEINRVNDLNGSDRLVEVVKVFEGNEYCTFFVRESDLLSKEDK